MKKAITKTAMVIATALTSGALAYAARSDIVTVCVFVALVTIVFSALTYSIETYE